MNSNLKIKVCGLTKLSQIQELISLNTDFLGFIFYKKSPRYALNFLTLEEIKPINHQGKTGVFVNENIAEIIDIANNSALNFIQLHGDENEDFISELREKLNPAIGIIKVFRIGNDIGNLKSEIDNLKSKIDYFLFDTDSKSFGGTGKSFGWEILNQIEIPKPYFLSGGISPENIQNLKLLNKKPCVLDINSRFETEPGNKNIEKIKNFKNDIENLDFN